MEDRDFYIISPHATPDQVDAIVRRRSAGHVGTVGMSRDVRNRVDNLDEDMRFKMIRNLLGTIRNSGD